SPRADGGSGARPLRPRELGTQEVAEDALVRLAGCPAVRTPRFPDLALQRRRRGCVPDARQVVVDLAQVADPAVVDRAREDVAPRVDEARGAERVAAHRRGTRLDVVAHPLEVGPLEEVDR